MGRRPRTDAGEQVFNRIQTERERRDMSRQELADDIGVHYQTVGYLERGEYSPSLVLALRIGRAFGQPVEHLFSLEQFEGSGPIASLGTVSGTSTGTSTGPATGPAPGTTNGPTNGPATERH